MKVLLFSHIQPPAVDGGSHIIAKLGEYFQSHQHLVKFISSDCHLTDDFASNHQSSQIYTNDNNSDQIRLPVITIFHRPFKFLSRFFPCLKVLAIGPIFSPFSCFRLLITSYSFHPDIIIAGPLPTTIVIYAKLIQLITRSKLIIIPCFHENDPDFHHPLLLSILKTSLVATLSDHETKYLHTPHIFILRAGVDQQFIASSPSASKKQNILFLGNFSAHKRIELLIDAFNQLATKYSQLTLTLAGQKTLYWPQLKNKLNSKIKVVDGYNYRQLSRLLDSATIMVMPSIHESFGLVFIESMSHFVPVIGSDIPAVAELINLTGGGLTFSSDDLNDLINVIERLLKNPSLRSRLGRCGHDYVLKHLTWDKIGDKLCQKISSS